MIKDALNSYLRDKAQNLHCFSKALHRHLSKCFQVSLWASRTSLLLAVHLSAAAAATFCLPTSVQVRQAKFWPSCRTPRAGCWAPSCGEDSALGGCWTEGRAHTDTSRLYPASPPTTPCWCSIRARGRTSDTPWSSSMWMWMWRRRNAHTWTAFTWVSLSLFKLNARFFHFCWGASE